MTSAYYAPGADRAEKVQKLFARIALRYDLINDLQSFGLHRLWKRKLVALAEPSPTETALDICCGTGDIGRLIARAGGRVIGCDFTREMLSAAPARNRVQSFVQGDALDLPLRSGSVDLAAISYGLRNLADFERGIREMLRVVKPGGRILILDFGRPRNIVWRALYFAYLRLVVPAFGLLFAGDAAAYRYILDSLQNYPAQDGVAEMLRRFGCDTVQVFNLLGGIMSIHRAIAPAGAT